jgi:WS/DGAT/MGAT family acyltransferase
MRDQNAGAAKPATPHKLRDGIPSRDRLSSLDNLFLLVEGQNTHMHVAITAIFEAESVVSGENGVDIERIRAFIGSRLHRIPRYRQRLTYTPPSSRPVWVDDDRFNINYHVRHISLPRPGNERQLQELAARIKSQQLDRDKPLWETWIVEGLQGGRFAMITKAHHCMVDGVSGADLLAELLQPAPQTSIEPPPPFAPRPAPSRLALLGRELERRVSTPLALAARFVREPQQGLQIVRDAVGVLGDVLPTALRRASDTPFNRPIGPHRRFAWLAMDLAAVKEIKNHLGGTLNDVVLAIVSGALRRFLQGRGVDVDSLAMRALVPVSTRTPDEQGTLGNRVAAWIVDLPVAEQHPWCRLDQLRATTANLKRSQQAVAAEALTDIADWAGSTIPSLAMQLALRACPFNLVVTNVPGPQLPLYLLGARMLEVYPQVPLFTNQGLGVALFSYAGRLFWGLNADWELLPDLDDFAEAVQEAFSELESAAALDAARSTRERNSGANGRHPARARVRSRSDRGQSTTVHR